MSVRCGNHGRDRVYHSNTQDVRNCYQSSNVMTATRPVSPAPARTSVVMDRLRRAHTTNSRLTPAPEPTRPAWGVNGATEPMMSYLRDLVRDREWQGKVSRMVGEIIQDIDEGNIAFEEARAAISELKEFPRKPRGDGKLVAEVKALKAEVPDGRYAVRINGSKLRFFLVKTGKTGRIVVKEYASDTLYDRTFKEYKGILEAIVEAGPEQARLTFAREMGRCWRCGIGLTDENNPYKLYGLGPDCGPKVMG